MKKLEFTDINEFAKKMKEDFQQSDSIYPLIVCVSKYNTARDILRALVHLDIEIDSINLNSDECDGYDKEFYICLTNNGIVVEKAYAFAKDGYKKDGYLYSEGDKIYVHEDCNSEILKHIESNSIFEVSIGSDKNECINNNMESTYVSRKSDGTPSGFSKSWSTSFNGMDSYSTYSFYSSDIDLLKDIAKRMDINL